MIVNAIIVEDEILSAKRLVRLIKDNELPINIKAQLESVTETVQFLKTHQDEIDLIFLDIHLVDGQSFEIFNQITVNTPIIFTTAYDEYALQAFSQMSVDYLLKPIKAQELVRSMDKFKRFQNAAVIDYQKIAEAIKSKNRFKKRFLVQTGAKIRHMNTENIHYFFVESKACFMMSDKGNIHDINYTLEKLMAELDDDTFFKLNRKVIVHINAIKEVVQFSRSRYKVDLKHAPPFDVFISTERMTLFKQWLNR